MWGAGLSGARDPRVNVRTVSGMKRRSLAVVVACLAAACSDDGSTVSAGDGTSTTHLAEAPSTLLATCASLEPAPPEVTGPLSSDPEIADAQRWRATMGLRSDEAWVLQVPSIPTTLPEAGAFAHPLTYDDVTEISARGGSVSEGLSSFGDRHPGSYGGLWIDHTRGGQTTIAFTSEVAERRAELDDELGVGRVHVVEVAHSERDLRALQDDVVAFLRGEDIPFGGVGLQPTINAVAIHLSVLDDASVRPIVERFGTDGICVEGMDPADVIPAGPQAEGGDGWRLLADEPGVGTPYRTGVAQDDDGYDALWAEIGIASERPPVDFTTEVVVWFGPAVSGSCSDIRLDDVVVDTEAGLVYPTIVLPGGDRTCTSDANPHAYVVALARDGLPPEFTLQLAPEVICTGCEEAGESETTQVVLAE